MAKRPGSRGKRTEEGPGAGTFTLLAPIRAIAEETERQTVRVAGHPAPTSEQLHRLHRNLRKLRAALRIAERALPKSRRPVVVDANRRLGRLARLVGDVRDLDVGLTHLPPLPTDGGPPEAAPEGLAVRRRMQEQARTGRSLLGAFLRSEIDRGLFRTTREVLDSAAGPLSGLPAPRLLRQTIAGAVERTERARRRAARRPATERLHQLRIELRRLHHFLDLGRAADPVDAARFPARLSELQSELGTLHDLDQLLEQVRALGADARRSSWAKGKAADRRALRGALAARVRKRTIRSAIADLA
jgi:CHAD domain-containing protein